MCSAPRYSAAARLARLMLSPSALLIAIMSASSTRPFLMPCSSSPAPGSINARKESVMSQTAVSDWPMPTVSTSTTSKPAASHNSIASPAFDQGDRARQRRALAGAEFFGEFPDIGGRILRQGHGLVYNARAMQARGPRPSARRRGGGHLAFELSPHPDQRRPDQRADRHGGEDRGDRPLEERQYAAIG